MRQLQHSEVFRKPPKRKIHLVADGISDHRNIGMLFRLADAFGVERIIFIIPPITITQKIKKISRATTQNVAFEFNNNVDDLIQDLKRMAVPILGLEMCNGSIDINNYEVDDNDEIALILGNENHGVSPKLLALCDQCLHIPLYGNNSSINVIHAAAIALHHIQTL